MYNFKRGLNYTHPKIHNCKKGLNCTHPKNTHLLLKFYLSKNCLEILTLIDTLNALRETQDLVLLINHTQFVFQYFIQCGFLKCVSPIITILSYKLYKQNVNAF